LGRFIVDILSMFGGRGWIAIGAITLVGVTIMLAIYLREPRERQAILYSLRNYLAAAAVGLAAIVLGAVQLWNESRVPSSVLRLDPATLKAMKK
jgi:hypothetical protein